MRKKSMSLLIISGLMLLFTVSLAGVTSAAQKALEITSSHFTMDYGTGVAYYEGGVKVVRENTIMQADEVQVFFTKEGAVEKIVAKGNVSIEVIQEKEKRRTGGKTVTYVAKDDKFILEGEAYYRDESGNNLLAEKIIIWMKAAGLERLEAEGTPIKATYILGE